MKYLLYANYSNITVLQHVTRVNKQISSVTFVRCQQLCYGWLSGTEL